MAKYIPSESQGGCMALLGAMQPITIQGLRRGRLDTGWSFYIFGKYRV